MVQKGNICGGTEKKKKIEQREGSPREGDRERRQRDTKRAGLTLYSVQTDVVLEEMFVFLKYPSLTYPMVDLRVYVAMVRILDLSKSHFLHRVVVGEWVRVYVKNKKEWFKK